ncbi:MAG TPA: PAS domain S-box protein, partial [Coriobacteriia bacterium]|nr:PAS domain S-box protein [Coriobacteriia bacterium]
MIRFVNRQTESLFGYDRDQLIGRPVETLVPESLWQIYTEHRKDYFADPRTRSSGLDVVLSGRHREGTEFPINVSLSHIDTGDVLLVITAALDVTRQKQAVKNAQLTAAIVQYSHDAIIGTTIKGMITSWNPAAERMYGYSAAEIIGRSARLLTPEDQPGLVDALLVRIKNGEAVDHLETTLVRKDGTVFPISLTVSPIRDEDGVVVGASVICRDVSEQQKALEAAQRMVSIVENSDDAIIGFTLDGIVTSWNPAAARMYGYSSQEAIGTSVLMRTPEDRIDEIKSIVANVGASRYGEHYETERIQKDGTVVPVSFTISPIRDASGAVVGASTTARDMSEQNQARAVVQRMAAIVESSEDAIIGRGLDDAITSWNPAAERLLGYSSEEIIGKS